MFPLPEVQKEFEGFTRVTLYVEDNDQGLLQDRLIKDSTLPAYVVLKPGTEEVVGFQGYTLNPGTRVGEFVKFLQSKRDEALK